MHATLRRFSLFNKRLLLSLVVLFSATVAMTTTVSITDAQAETYCLGANYGSCGGITYVSCGSSAGNYIAHCDCLGCEIYTGELNQAIADSVCDSHGSNITPGVCTPPPPPAD
jgi:hypothetical protein